MTGAEIIAQARTYIGRGIKYELGADDLTPPDLALDCSAFVWRVLGERKFDGRRWRNTDWIVGDALGAQTRFVKLDKPEPGCIAVYGRRLNGGKVGHVAVVVDPKARTIIDCSDSQNGVTEHDGSYFWRRAARGRALWVRLK